MKSFLIACSSLLLAAVVLPAADSAAKPGEAPKPNPPEKRELLSKHDTVAEFVKTEDSPCRFKTSLCPDQCDHGGKVAVFKIIRYLDYQKPGQYGDAKADTFTFFISFRAM